MLDRLNIFNELESYEDISDNISKGVVFSGTNLLVLVFAIIVASVGLNVNSTAVIIGAMLISPLMGPIMGVGLGLGTYNFILLRLSLKNLGFAVGVSLLSSTLYFLITPLNQAHSELFARTSPNIYDVIIAFFGGLAGIAAITSKQKGNALQGAAIATALMPPLCTAGFGLATKQWNFFFGAFYLFIINSVFISLATYIMVRLLKFPKFELDNHNSKWEVLVKRLIIFVTSLTLIPSIYLGYQLIQKERFFVESEKFIANEINMKNSFILEKNISFEDKTIRITVGGEEINKEIQKSLQTKLSSYHLEDARLLFKSTLSFADNLSKSNNINNEKIQIKNFQLDTTIKKLRIIEKKQDSIKKFQRNLERINKEILTQYEFIKAAHIFYSHTDSLQQYVLAIRVDKPFNEEEKMRLKKWLQVRLDSAQVDIYAEIKNKRN
ncbi:MAG: DUF389 domain-containing protein [Thermonemataceae bacterium]|nr:DUF389 domain-containing protein [Thermonemataceae bacterium]